jgi:hypothetical protein
MWGQHPWAWGWRRNGWSFGVGDAPACAGGWRRTRRLDGVHLGGRGRCTTKPSPSFRKPSQLQYWRSPSPSWPNYGRWWVEEGARFQESITTRESQKTGPRLRAICGCYEAGRQIFRASIRCIGGLGKNKESQTWYMYEMNYKVSWIVLSKLQNMLACRISLSNLNVGHEK